MLILTRRPGESIRIGEDIFITYLKNSGTQCRLGFEAPEDINIVRTEIIGKQKKGEEE